MKNSIVLLFAFCSFTVARAGTYELPNEYTVCDKFVNKYGRIYEENCRVVQGKDPNYKLEFDGPLTTSNYDSNEIIGVRKSEGGWIYIQRRNGKTETWSETSPGHYEKR